MERNSIIVLILIIHLLACQTKSGQKNNTDTHRKNLQKQKTAPTPEKSKTPSFKITNQTVDSVLLHYFQTHPERKVKITTKFGDIIIKLYDETPLHTANFLMLTEKQYFNGTYFDRVVKNFVIQGGSNDDVYTKIKQRAIGKYTIPAEFSPKLFHKKGAVAMARQYQDNPHKRSSPFEFYIVHGSTFSEKELKKIEQTKGIKFTNEAKELYQTIGGAAHLDYQHTVFGEVIQGMDIVEKIANVPVDKSDWPKEDIVINVNIVH